MAGVKVEGTGDVGRRPKEKREMLPLGLAGRGDGILGLEGRERGLPGSEGERRCVGD